MTTNARITSILNRLNSFEAKHPEMADLLANFRANFRKVEIEDAELAISAVERLYAS